MIRIPNRGMMIELTISERNIILDALEDSLRYCTGRERIVHLKKIERLKLRIENSLRGEKV